jgi:hypothetical protein
MRDASDDEVAIGTTRLASPTFLDPQTRTISQKQSDIGTVPVQYAHTFIGIKSQCGEHEKNLQAGAKSSLAQAKVAILLPRLPRRGATP